MYTGFYNDCDAAIAGDFVSATTTALPTTVFFLVSEPCKYLVVIMSCLLHSLFVVYTDIITHFVRRFLVIRRLIWSRARGVRSFSPQFLLHFRAAAKPKGRTAHPPCLCYIYNQR